MMSITINVVTAIVSVFANFPDKIARITENFGDADKARNWGVFCQQQVDRIGVDWTIPIN